MKKLLLVALVLLAASGAAQAQNYEKLEPQEYLTNGKKVPLFKSPTDTTKASFHLFPNEKANVVGRLAPTFAVVKRDGFVYYVPNHYVIGFSADPARMAALLAAATPKTEEYCVMHSVCMKDCNLRVDYGQRRTFSNIREKDKYGNVLEFNSPADALNYMNSQGWELVTAYPGTTFIAGGLTQVPAVYYVMKRRIQP